MKTFTKPEDKSASSGPYEETAASRTGRPQVYTTKYGSQYVDVVDVIQSEAGWAEIQRLRDANLVAENGSSPHSDNRIG
jgi:hypothetical protein